MSASCAKEVEPKVISARWVESAVASFTSRATMLVAGKSRIMRKVKATSSASSASPSVKRESSRSSIVTTVPSSFHSSEVPSHGSDFPGCIAVTRNRFS